jgi:hypothetical protein
MLTVRAGVDGAQIISHSKNATTAAVKTIVLSLAMLVRRIAADTRIATTPAKMTSAARKAMNNIRDFLLTDSFKAADERVHCRSIEEFWSAPAQLVAT